MTASSLKVRSLVLAVSLGAVASIAVASPLTVPPLPQTKPHFTMAASPLTVPPLPPTKPGRSLMAASPLTVPPLPPTKPGVTA